MPDFHPTIEPSLSLLTDGKQQLGARRIRLLEAIASEGSISAAAKAAGLSYKAAWDGVHAMNNLFPKPLVSASTGGKGGGGANLTIEGRQVVQAFARVQEELEHFTDTLNRLVSEPHAPTTKPRPWRLLMRTSARNMLRCHVEAVNERALNEGAVMGEVVLQVSEQTQLTAAITHDSIAELELAPGREAIALIKANFVVLHSAPDNAVPNQIPAQIISIHPGETNTEVVMDIGDGKTLTAVSARDKITDLDLCAGQAAWASIPPSYIILGVD